METAGGSWKGTWWNAWPIILRSHRGSQHDRVDPEMQAQHGHYGPLVGSNDQRGNQEGSQSRTGSGAARARGMDRTLTLRSKPRRYDEHRHAAGAAHSPKPQSAIPKSSKKSCEDTQGESQSPGGRFFPAAGADTSTRSDLDWNEASSRGSADLDWDVSALDRDVGAYRPIAHLGAVGKVIEATLARKLSDAALLPTYRWVQETQITKVATRVVTDAVHTTWQHKACAALLQLDLAGAFDTVSQGVLCMASKLLHRVNCMSPHAPKALRYHPSFSS
ncbi:hypothetical protein N7461_004433 [Penicillium sp. DV-2018c]|nr:hypothetical protein N7461_004433 [Penicillium sp. DV-2018c]